MKRSTSQKGQGKDAWHVTELFEYKLGESG